MAPVNLPAVRVHIQELELEGVDPAGRFELARGLEQELVRLFTDRGVPARLQAGEAGVPSGVAMHGLSPHDLGRAVALAMYEGWQ